MPLRILIIDDDDAFAQLAELRLRAWQSDAEISRVDSITAARSLLETASPFALVLLDQHLPDGMGTELLSHPALESSAVLAMSSDEDPIVPANAVRAGAGHFLAKLRLRDPLFLPLVEALLEQKRAQNELIAARIRESRLQTIKTLVATLRHEINNPLGAVLGGVYLLRNSGLLENAATKKDPGSKQNEETIRLIEASGERIGHVLKELCRAAELDELEEVTKARESVFQVPGDPKWDE